MQSLRDHLNDFRLNLQSNGRILKPGCNLRRFAFKTMNRKGAKMDTRASEGL